MKNILAVMFDVGLLLFIMEMFLIFVLRCRKTSGIRELRASRLSFMDPNIPAFVP